MKELTKLSNFFENIEIYKDSLPDSDLVKIVRQRVETRAKHVFKDFEKKCQAENIPLTFQGVKSELIAKLAMIDIGRQQALTALNKRLTPGDKEDLANFANRVFTTVDAAFPNMTDIDSTAIEYFTDFINDPQLKLNLKLVKSPGMSFQEIVSKAIAGKETLREEKRRERIQNSDQRRDTRSFPRGNLRGRGNFRNFRGGFRPPPIPPRNNDNAIEPKAENQVKPENQTTTQNQGNNLQNFQNYQGNRNLNFLPRNQNWGRGRTNQNKIAHHNANLTQPINQNLSHEVSQPFY